MEENQREVRYLLEEAVKRWEEQQAFEVEETSVKISGTWREAQDNFDKAGMDGRARGAGTVDDMTRPEKQKYEKKQVILQAEMRRSEEAGKEVGGREGCEGEELGEKAVKCEKH